MFVILALWFSLAAWRSILVQASAQTKAIAELSAGRCNVSEDMELCTRCAFFVINCTPLANGGSNNTSGNDSFTYLLDMNYYALSKLSPSIGALTGLRELVFGDPNGIVIGKRKRSDGLEDTMNNNDLNEIQNSDGDEHFATERAESMYYSRVSSRALPPLTGTIPTEIGRMSSLRVFILANQMVGGTLPTEIGLLGQSLEQIDISMNGTSSGNQPRIEGTLLSSHLIESCISSDIFRVTFVC
jgi:hypothetical protein